MTEVLIATGSESVFRNVDAAIVDEETSLVRVHRGADVLEAISERDPDLVLLDLQIGNMGGVATCLAIRQEEGFDRLDFRPVGLLLDRADDKFIAGRAGADGWVTKPLNPLKLKKLIQQLTSVGASNSSNT